MRIEQRIEDIIPSSTNTNPREYRLHLTASGNYNEIKWYERELAKIGETKNTKNAPEPKELKK